MTGDRRFDKLAALARRTVRTKFEEQNEGLFLLGKSPSGETGATLGFSTGSYAFEEMKRAEEADLAAQTALQKSGRFIEHVRKKDANEWIKWVSVGRARNNDIVLRHSSISKLHARINIEGTAAEPDYTLTDLGSSKGSQVNGAPLKPDENAPLKPGDRVRFGKLECRFLDSGQLYDALRSIR